MKTHFLLRQTQAGLPLLLPQSQGFFFNFDVHTEFLLVQGPNSDSLGLGWGLRSALLTLLVFPALCFCDHSSRGLVGKAKADLAWISALPLILSELREPIRFSAHHFPAL